eukprot:tig00021070_g17915.t1
MLAAARITVENLLPRLKGGRRRSKSLRSYAYSCFASWHSLVAGTPQGPESSAAAVFFRLTGSRKTELQLWREMGAARLWQDAARNHTRDWLANSSPPQTLLPSPFRLLRLAYGHRPTRPELPFRIPPRLHSSAIQLRPPASPGASAPAAAAGASMPSSAAGPAPLPELPRGQGSVPGRPAPTDTCAEGAALLPDHEQLAREVPQAPTTLEELRSAILAAARVTVEQARRERALGATAGGGAGVPGQTLRRRAVLCFTAWLALVTGRPSPSRNEDATAYIHHRLTGLQVKGKRLWEEAGAVPILEEGAAEICAEKAKQKAQRAKAGSAGGRPRPPDPRPRPPPPQGGQLQDHVHGQKRKRDVRGSDAVALVGGPGPGPPSKRPSSSSSGRPPDLEGHAAAGVRGRPGAGAGTASADPPPSGAGPYPAPAGPSGAPRPPGHWAPAPSNPYPFHSAPAHYAPAAAHAPHWHGTSNWPGARAPPFPYPAPALGLRMQDLLGLLGLLLGSAPGRMHMQPGPRR